jgi:hypothetical protein
MGPRRKNPKASHCRDEQGSERVLDKQEKEHKNLIQSLIYTLHHFFGGFSPSIL